MINITFEDYCVAYQIFEPVFASTLHGVPEQVMQVAIAVRKLHHGQKRPVTVQEVAKELGWESPHAYKHVKNAVKAGFLKYERGTREKNVKRLVPRDRANAFLPHPRRVLKRNPEIGCKVKYVDPLTGKWKNVNR